MKALIYTGPNTVRYGDVEEPVPGEGDVLVRVEAVGICGSDMHAYHGHDDRRPAPLVLGHEAAGRIVSGPRAGERVTIDPLVTCGLCRFCLEGRSHLCRLRQIISMPPRPGAFAELVRIPERNLVPVPDGFDLTRAALAEPAAVGWHAARIGAAALYRPLATARCVVLGGGAIGLSSALVLTHFGAEDVAVAEMSDLRRQTVAAAGPLRPYAPGESGEPADGSAELVIDAVGAHATRAAASRLVSPGGVIVHAGLLPGAEGLDVRRITLQEVTVIGTYCYTHVDFMDTLAALAAGRLGPLGWIMERPLAEGWQAFRDLDAGKVAAAKIVLHP
jgi:threonine dehydrogenase-like Zn-dependent dehydrogenase